jgi:hypothetical protein
MSTTSFYLSQPNPGLAPSALESIYPLRDVPDKSFEKILILYGHIVPDLLGYAKYSRCNLCHFKFFTLPYHPCLLCQPISFLFINHAVLVSTPSLHWRGVSVIRISNRSLTTSMAQQDQKGCNICYLENSSNTIQHPDNRHNSPERSNVQVVRWVTSKINTDVWWWRVERRK